MADFHWLIFVMDFPRQFTIRRKRAWREMASEMRGKWLEMRGKCHFWGNKKGNNVQSRSFFQRINEGVFSSNFISIESLLTKIFLLDFVCVCERFLVFFHTRFTLYVIISSFVFFVEQIGISQIPCLCRFFSPNLCLRTWIKNSRD